MRLHADRIDLLSGQAVEHVPKKDFISKIQTGQTRRKRLLPDEGFQVP